MVLLIFASCSSNKSLTKTHKTAAQIFESTGDHSKFVDEIKDSIGSEKLIVIYTKRQSMSRGKSVVKISYDSKIKKWNGAYTLIKSPGRGSVEKDKTFEWNNLEPKSGWAIFINSIIENKIHSIKDGRDIEYKRTHADGTSYSVQLKINDKFRRYGQSNPALYSKENPSIEDFKNMTNIITLFDNEFIKHIDITSSQ